MRLTPIQSIQLLCLTAAVMAPASAFSAVTGTVNFEALFNNAFAPGGAPGIGYTTGGVLTGSSSGSATTDVDLDGDSSNDLRVNMSYGIFRSTGDSAIGFRNSSGSDITMYSDSNTGTDYDYGFLFIKYSFISINATNSFISVLPTLTTSSLNGNTEEYEFGILDLQGSVTSANIAGYNANDYTGGDGFFAGTANSLGGDANEILLPEHLGVSLPGVTYDAGATMIGDLTNAATVASTGVSDNISATPTSEITLWYGGFDLGYNTSIGNPEANFSFSGTVSLIPEPSAALLALCGLGLVATRRSK